MKFAFLIPGRFAAARDRAQIRGGVQIVGVADRRGVHRRAAALPRRGWMYRTLRAFGAEGAKKVTDATDNKIPVGYVTHLPSQEKPYRSAFLRWRKKKGKSEKKAENSFLKTACFP